MPIQFIKNLNVNGKKVEVVGCWDDSDPDAQSKFDFYDLYYQGECINLGEPYYEMPTKADAKAHLEAIEAIKDLG
jgi:hypothetical protein